MKTVKTSLKGIDYLEKDICYRPKTFTKAFFWKIPRSSGQTEVSLKIGRYNRETDGFLFEEYSAPTPKVEITLDKDELAELVSFLQEVYEPFKRGYKKFVPIGEDIENEDLHYLTRLFSETNESTLLNFFRMKKVMAKEMLVALSNINRIEAVKQFETMLTEDLLESAWQKWFQDNSWVLGTDFVEILTERKIDSSNIADLIMKAYDGFVDIVEIKRPNGGSNFWASTLDHGNYIPSVDLIKAINQTARYILELERESNNAKQLERFRMTKTIKPRAVLIYGRSDGWNESQIEAFRLQNDMYNNITIMTYDHVLNRAKQIVGLERLNFADNTF